MDSFFSDDSSDSNSYELDDLDRRRHNLFTKEDDETLKSIINKYFQNDLRNINWNFVALHMANKNRRQCKDRYINYLRDGLNNEKFSAEENFLLLTKVEEFGHRWRVISRFFRNRTDIMIKSQYRKLMRRNATKDNVRFVVIEKRKKKAHQVSNSINSTKNTEQLNFDGIINGNLSSNIETQININDITSAFKDLDDIDEFTKFYE
ncbi:Myb-like DNA-binding domain containing protein [Trichomonas vaginalis G3]|uniref:Myb-like DNA-binding domain containing protein n=1 Tax=Trichomonas vaginalis (strain ATCC PRA-98 / G3) TaxID=412133 RepID=A2D7R9_TRIV3|nr:RNA polymerase II transcription regulator recruiting protein [Trichomonas vaginalis G3]EAY23352.1 Myb-like DNA-binding domain containing protein [Trichomonas vaginalis G3]KAI5493760.1 RNA polymerase II transcription regulator recruiting protein [Trichomonas vaginalis G3]|eukprot:XP_001584338.1 Myb-like DNA-binding domain containing protein [Trichomonas vaginalis G3]